MLGITPPKYRKEGELSNIANYFYTWFSEVIDKPDVVIWNGDLVDGEGRRESTYHVTTDIYEQLDMACDVVKMVGAKKNIFVFGTAYHTGYIFDYEKVIAKEFNEDIKTRQKVEIGGIRFDCMHTVGKSGTPTGGDIMLRKAGLWSAIYDQLDGRDHADIVVRSHIHEYRLIANEHIKVVTTPAMKLGLADYDRYGRKLDGYYSVGFIEFNFKNGACQSTVYPIPHLFKYEISGGYKKV